VFWLIAGLILTGIGGAVLAGVTSLFTRGAGASRATAIRVALLLPLACLIWVGVVFVAQAAVNSELLHRDIGIGDNWYAPLPNGYQISFVDVTDQGTVEVAGGGSGINGVRLLQVYGPYLFGGTDTHSFEHFGSNTNEIDSYFVLDTHTRRLTTEPDLSALTAAAGRLGVSLRLEPVYTVYSRYRFSWFDVVAGCMLVLPPLAALVALGIWVFRLRRNRATTAIA
jgi:hypothetical protein